MTELEKVIKGLECCMGEGQCCGMCDNCPYNTDKMRCDLATLHQEALELLKAQEPLLVKHTTSTIRCPKCNKQITGRGSIHNEIKYCWKCGQAVKWE